MIAMCSHVEVPSRTFLGKGYVAAVQVPRERRKRVDQLPNKREMRDRIGWDGTEDFEKKRTSPAAASRSSASLPRRTPSYVNRSLGQRIASRCSSSKRRRLKAWPTTVMRVGYAPVSSRKRAMEKSKFWNESSAASSIVTRVNRSADGRRPAARARRKYDSASDVALNGDVWPLMGTLRNELS